MIVINKSDQPKSAILWKEKLSRRLDIFEYAEEHKDCPEHTNEYEIGGKRYIVHSHFVGQKDIDNVLSEIAVSRALSEVLYNNNNANAEINTGKNLA